MDAAGRRRLYLSLAGLLCLVLLVVFLRSDGFRGGSGSGGSPLGVSLRMQGVELLHGKQGRMQWRLRTPRAEMGRDRREIRLTRPELIYPREEGTFRVASREGKYDRQNETAVFWSEVQGSYDDLDFTAGRMRYLARQSRIELLEGVRVTRDSGTSIRSRRADLYLEKRRFVFYREAEVNLHEQARP